MSNSNENKNVMEPINDNGIKASEDLTEKQAYNQGNSLTDSLTFDDYVIEKIAAIASREVPGVLELKGGFFSGITEAFAASSDTNTQGVSVEIDEKNVVINLKAVLEYGKSAPEIFNNVKEIIKHRVTEMTGLTVTAVNMKVNDIMTAQEYSEIDVDEK